MLLVGEDPRKYIHQYSQEFLSAFMKQLRTAHGTKPVHINHFYQEYIQDKGRSSNKFAALEISRANESY